MEERSNKFKTFTNKTFLLRVISLLCAILLWFYVSEVESPTAEKSVEAVAITLRNKDIMMNETGLSVISDAVFETNIVLSGKKSTLNKIDYEDITATVDLSKITESGTYELPISVVAPAGTSVVSTNPRYVTLAVDKTVSKPFDIETDIYYSSTYEIGECIITDTQSKVLTAVTVSGPATDVERIGSVVARVDFGAIISSVEAKTNLVCLDVNGQELTDADIKLTPQSVIVKQPVYMTKTLPLKAVQANNTFSDSQISFKVKPSTIEVKGDPKLLNSLNEITLDPINERTVIGDALTNTVNSLIKLPEGIELISGQNTATITVNVRNVKKQTFTFTTDDIVITNLSDILEMELDKEEWTYTVINTSSKDITKEDISIKLDLTNYLSSGIYTVNVIPEINEKISYAYSPMESGYAVSFELVKK